MTVQVIDWTTKEVVAVLEQNIGVSMMDSSTQWGDSVLIRKLAGADAQILGVDAEKPFKFRVDVFGDLPRGVVSPQRIVTKPKEPTKPACCRYFNCRRSK